MSEGYSEGADYEGLIRDSFSSAVDAVDEWRALRDRPPRHYQDEDGNHDPELHAAHNEEVEAARAVLIERRSAAIEDLLASDRFTLEQKIVMSATIRERLEGRRIPHSYDREPPVALPEIANGFNDVFDHLNGVLNFWRNPTDFMMIADSDSIGLHGSRGDNNIPTINKVPAGGYQQEVLRVEFHDGLLVNVGAIAAEASAALTVRPAATNHVIFRPSHWNNSVRLEQNDVERDAQRYRFLDEQGLESLTDEQRFAFRLMSSQVAGLAGVDIENVPEVDAPSLAFRRKVTAKMREGLVRIAGVDQGIALSYQRHRRSPSTVAKAQIVDGSHLLAGLTFDEIDAIHSAAGLSTGSIRASVDRYAKKQMASDSPSEAMRGIDISERVGKLLDVSSRNW